MLAHAARSPRASAMLPTRMNLLRPLDRYLLVEGLRLHVLDWGGDGRTPLLLLHGFTGHAHAWDTLSIALQPHFHVYALDARGHGDSDPADAYNAIAAFDDISGVVDQLGLRALVLVGLSMGGRNAMYFTSKRPGLVQKLVIVDIGPELSHHAAYAGSARGGKPRPRPGRCRADGKRAAPRQIRRDPSGRPHPARGQPRGGPRRTEELPRVLSSELTRSSRRPCHEARTLRTRRSREAGPPRRGRHAARSVARRARHHA